MGLFDLFRKNSLPEGDPATQKAGHKLISKNTDLSGRYNAAETLANIGTDEAIYCLLHRFTVVRGTDIPDEDEKTNARNKIFALGKTSIPPIMRFLKNKDFPAQALELLEALTDEDMYLEKLLELTQSLDPYFSKFPDKKLQTFKRMAQIKSDRIIEALEPFLDDDDDDVRIAVIEAIEFQDNEEASRELILQSIVENHERPRIRTIACRIIAEKHWKTTGYRKQIATSLPDRFFMDSKGFIKEKSS